MLDLFNIGFPDNVEVQTKLDTLQTRKKAFIKKLWTNWEARPQPLFTEQDIIELNMAHEVDETDQANREALGLARTRRTND